MAPRVRLALAGGFDGTGGGDGSDGIVMTGQVVSWDPDGGGYIVSGNSHVFLMPEDLRPLGSPRILLGATIVFVARRHSATLLQIMHILRVDTSTARAASDEAPRQAAEAPETHETPEVDAAHDLDVSDGGVCDLDELRDVPDAEARAARIAREQVRYARRLAEMRPSSLYGANDYALKPAPPYSDIVQKLHGKNRPTPVEDRAAPRGGIATLIDKLLGRGKLRPEN